MKYNVCKIGDRYGMLTIQSRAEDYIALSNGEPHKHRKWSCVCDCGNSVIALQDYLRKGAASSCGCVPRAHGSGALNDKSSLRLVWSNMLRRCNSSECNEYPYYGGRGVSVCEEWRDARAFIEWSVSNGWQRGLDLDRIDNNGNYEPGNCRFITHEENMQNRRGVKLNAEQVAQARVLRGQGLQPSVIARMFGMSRSGMRSAINGRTWKNVPTISNPQE